jgi:2-amino-4-hydroxy-6-hydroxymethyldihydropteridine diphosphokinase
VSDSLRGHVGNAPARVSRAYVGFGGNLADPADTLRSAAAELGREAGRIAAASPVYRSLPVGVTDQPPFLNAVAALDTPLGADALLDVLLAVEAAHGRVRDVRWGPRTLDLDLLWFEGVVRDDARLTLPHPRAHEREFVLRPLCDLAPDLPLRGRTAREWLAALPPQGVVRAGLSLM